MIFCNLYSDVHCPVSLHVNLFYDYNSLTTVLPEQEKIRLWDYEKRDTFLNNFDIREVDILSNKLYELQVKQQICQTDMDQFVREVSDFHVKTAKLSFGTANIKQNTQVPQMVENGLTLNVNQQEKSFISRNVDINSVNQKIIDNV